MREWERCVEREREEERAGWEEREGRMGKYTAGETEGGREGGKNRKCSGRIMDQQVCVLRKKYAQ
jgi:hypothetical protein